MPADVWAIGPRNTGLSWSGINIQVTAADTKHNTMILDIICTTKHYSKRQIKSKCTYTIEQNIKRINNQMTQVFVIFQYKVSRTQQYDNMYISIFSQHNYIFILMCVTTLHVSALCVGHHQVCLEL